VITDLILSKFSDTKNEFTNYLENSVLTKMQWKSKNNHYVALKTNTDMTHTILKQILGKKTSKKYHKPLIQSIHQILT